MAKTTKNDRGDVIFLLGWMKKQKRGKQQNGGAKKKGTVLIQ